MTRKTWLALLTALVVGLVTAAAQTTSAIREAIIARAKALELKTSYVPVPGDPLEHHASGLARVMCSAVFITGLDPAFAAENVGYFVAPPAERAQLGTPKIDRPNRSVEVALPNGTVRVAKQVGSQGCVTLPLGEKDVQFKPSVVESALPDAKSMPWPMGDAPSGLAFPPGIDRRRIQQAAETAFDPAGLTAAFLVTHKGQIIAERYGDGITATTPLESWSMGKSLSGTLMGVLIQQGVYDLWQPAPIPEWQSSDDSRSRIRIADILRMSSGLRIIAPQDPDYDPAGPYPDHTYLYTGSTDSFRYAATRPPQWPPNAVGRYRNTDPVLINYLIRLAVEKRGEQYHSFPQRALFDKLGIRHMVLDTDPYGNFLTQGSEQGTARDWARIANLYLQDGVWNGERLLPAGFVKFVSTLAPAWVADNRPIYGAMFWINGDSAYPAPKEAFYMRGVNGQTVLIIPSHQLAVIRLGHDKGSAAGDRAFREAVRMILDEIRAS